MQYEDATERDKQAMEAVSNIDSIGHILQHIDHELSDKGAAEFDALMYSIEYTGKQICENACVLRDYISELEPAR